MDEHTPEAFYRSLPMLTRFVLSTTFFVTLAYVLEIFDPVLLLMDWRSVVGRLQVWRLFSDYLFIGPFSFGWLIQMYFFVTFSTKLEQNEIFQNSAGSYLYFLIFQMLTLDVASLVLYWPTGKPILGPALSFAIIYYWSRREPWGQVGLWGFTVQAYQFPFALLFLDILLGNSLWNDLMGLFSGHLFFFLRDIVPTEYGFDLLGKTPSILDDFITAVSSFSLSGSGASQGPPVGSSSSSSSRPRTSFPGQGHVLGSAGEHRD